MTKVVPWIIAPKRFVNRLVKGIVVGLFFIVIALLIGMLGYHFLENMTWVDAFVNAAMILSGMGPLNPLFTPAGKIFAGCYALFSGLMFILIIGIIFAPVIHLFFHRLHIDDEANDK